MVIFYAMRQASQGDRNFKIRFQIREYLIGNQEISLYGFIAIFIISVRKVARAYGVHKLLGFPSFFACASVLGF